MPRVCLLWTTVVVTALLLAVSPVPRTSGASSVASSDWLSQARDQVARAEYHFNPRAEGGFSAPNRAQGLRLRADANGVQLSPRKKDRASWNLGLALRGFGRAGGMVTAGRAEVRAVGERVEQKRQALGMTEWYVNGTRGIEQGYTIDARPAGGEDGDQFDERFGASVAGAGDVNGDGFADVLVGAYQYDNGEFDEGTAFLYYGSSTGPSPLPAWSFEPNQTGAWFGYSVASAGDVNGDGYADIIVGAPLYDDLVVDNGRAYVFLGSSTGLGSQTAWTAEIGQANARFGSSG